MTMHELTQAPTYGLNPQELNDQDLIVEAMTWAGRLSRIETPAASVLTELARRYQALQWQLQDEEHAHEQTRALLEIWRESMSDA